MFGEGVGERALRGDDGDVDGRREWWIMVRGIV